MIYAKVKRRSRPGPPGSGPGDFYRSRQRRRALALAAATPGGPTLEQVACPEALIAAYDALASHGGPAPGPDRLTYTALGRGEACAILRDLSLVIRAGDYRPAAGRTRDIAKPGGGTRTLTIVNVIDRVVAAAVNRALTPCFEAIFLPCNYGFRPGRGTQDLLADLMAAMTALQITVLAIDDVKRAFDNVAIATLMEILTEYIQDPSLLQLIETVLRGGTNRDRTVGIPQGSPLSPLTLNVMLHQVHDRPLDGNVNFPPLFRYADNLTYLTGSVPEAHQTLDQVRRLLAQAGLTLKGQDGPPIDLSEGGETRLLGFRLSIRDGRLRLDLGKDALEDDLARCLDATHDDPDPHRAARMALRGWITSYGPALGDLAESDLKTIVRTAARHGFRELTSMEELKNWCTAAHARWTERYEKSLQRLGVSDDDLVFVAAPPATVDPGV